MRYPYLVGKFNIGALVACAFLFVILPVFSIAISPLLVIWTLVNLISYAACCFLEREFL